MRRCTNPLSDDYVYYGGRGITLHEPWHDPAVFVREVEAEIGPMPPDLTLDRVNNDGDYAPGNIRWATRLAQARNRRSAWPTRVDGRGKSLGIPAERRRKTLTQHQVRDIIAAITAGDTQTETAKRFDVSQAHVSRLVRDARLAGP